MRDFAEHHEAHQDRKVFARFYTYLKPHLRTFVLAFVLMILGTFTGIILPLASGLAIDQMQNPLLNLAVCSCLLVQYLNISFLR